MSDDVRRFYDDLAGDYHLLFADWRQSMVRQAEVLQRIIQEALGPGSATVLDAACGIGTQAIGLALRGYQVDASDLSGAAVSRAAAEAEQLQAAATFSVADLRHLDMAIPGQFDVVMACDNALPHLLTDEDLLLALANMAAKLRPDGLFIASLRDYDQIAREQPRSQGPRVFADPARRVTLQVWDWTGDGQFYLLHRFILQREDAAWHMEHFEAPYRALRRAELERAVTRVGLNRVRWYEPEHSGYFQPLVTARRPRQLSPP